ncbi:uncharacterized protein LOC119721741 [Patiria miniata]|uniref:Uncharacterized protein n=1 Tax=Patiria miniata TaxID=46514 RepID=A0A913Z9E9_PATMI|nr:uncharacterized protein LOC119721741 [Patiria miniata]
MLSTDVPCRPDPSAFDILEDICGGYVYGNQKTECHIDMESFHSIIDDRHLLQEPVKLPFQNKVIQAHGKTVQMTTDNSESATEEDSSDTSENSSDYHGSESDESESDEESIVFDQLTDNSSQFQPRPCRGKAELEANGKVQPSSDSSSDGSDSSFDEIHIEYYKQKEVEGGLIRAYNKFNACLFCEKLVNDGGVTMGDFLKPSKFDAVIQAVEDLAGQDEGEGGDHELQRPSFALKAGYDLAWLARIKRGRAIRSHDITSEEEANKFLQLHRSEWGLKVSASACNTLNTRKSKKPVSLPKTSDLQKLSKYVTSEVKKCNEMFTTSSTANYSFLKRMQKVTLVRLLLFNKRRPLELSQITTDTYINRPGWNNSRVEELLCQMTSLEKKLLESHDLLKMIGKRGRTVPVIVPPDCSKSLNAISKLRHLFIPPSNQYMFARNTPSTHMQAGHVLKEIISEVSLDSPQDIRTTKMQKYTATVAQILSLQPHQLEWVASHLGHSVNIHKDFYRVQDSTIELCKVSKLLMAIDAGDVGQWAGKSLDDIQVEDIEMEATDEIDDDGDEDEQEMNQVSLQTCFNKSSSAREPSPSCAPRCTPRRVETETRSSSREMPSELAEGSRPLRVSGKGDKFPWSKQDADRTHLERKGTREEGMSSLYHSFSSHIGQKNLAVLKESSRE